MLRWGCRFAVSDSLFCLSSSPRRCYRWCLIVWLRWAVAAAVDSRLEQVLQVFVQQTLVTSYKKTKCSFNDIRE